MVRQGSITEQHLQDATLFAKKGKRLGDVLVDLNIIQSEEIEDHVRMQILEVASNVMINPPKKLAFTKTQDTIQVVSEPVAVLWINTLMAGSIFFFFLALQMMNAFDKIIG